MERIETGKRLAMFALVVIVSVTVVSLVASRTGVSAATFTVTNLNDSGAGSLRQAILDANTNAGADEINFQVGLTGTITLVTGQLDIADDLTLNGPGANLLTVSGNNACRVFEVMLGVTAAISDLTISNGMGSGVGGGGIRTAGQLDIRRITLTNNSAFQGGGIFHETSLLTITDATISGNSATQAGGGLFNAAGRATITTSNVSSNSAGVGGGVGNTFSGSLTIVDSHISNNSAGSGGGIANEGPLLINGSTVSGNTATSLFSVGGGIDTRLASTLTITDSSISGNSAHDGGGISSTQASTTITRSTISGNSASQAGGIFSSEHNTLAITNSTISGNSASPFQGGGILNRGDTVSITGCTISGNSAPPNQFGSAGGLFNVSNVMTVKNSIVANNTNGDCFNTSSGSIIGLGTNFTTDGSCPGSAQVTSAQLNLGPLQISLPGTTATHALLAGSVAIDAVTDCTDIAGAPLTTDQRGVNRPVDGDNNGSALCDAGAFEAFECALACPPNQIASTGPGATDCCTVVNYPPPTFDATCGEVDCSPPAGSCYPVGVTLVTCGTVQDGPSCTFTVTVTDNTPPTITCPSNVSMVTLASCPPGANQVVNYPSPVVSDNCLTVTSSCSPPSGSSFPPGVSTVTCTAKDAANNTAMCSFTVTVFNGSLQDDSDSSRVVVFDTATGSYSFCCNGTVFTGKGTVSLRGCIFTLQHNAPDRRVSINADFSTKRGTASIQSPPGVIKCTISDRNLANNTRSCP